MQQQPPRRMRAQRYSVQLTSPPRAVYHRQPCAALAASALETGGGAEKSAFERWSVTFDRAPLADLDLQDGRRRSNSEPVIPSWEFVARQVAVTKVDIEEFNARKSLRKKYARRPSVRAIIQTGNVGSVKIRHLHVNGATIKSGTPEALFDAMCIPYFGDALIDVIMLTHHYFSDTPTMLRRVIWRYLNPCKDLSPDNEESFAECVRLASLRASMTWAAQPQEVMTRNYAKSVSLLLEFCEKQLLPCHIKWGMEILKLLNQHGKDPEADIQAAWCTPAILEVMWRCRVTLKKALFRVSTVKTFNGEEAVAVATKKYGITEERVVELANTLLVEGSIHACKAKETEFVPKKNALYYFADTFKEQLPKPIFTKQHKTAFIGMTEYHPIEVARQLTLLEYEMLCPVTVYELSHKNWARKPEEVKVLAPNLTKYIEWSNKISVWVASEIITTPLLRTRVVVLSRFIQVAAQCHKYGNWNGLFEVMLGLQMASVARLKFTWQGLESADQALFNKLLYLVSSDNNYATYREALHAMELPFLPYLGLWLKDLFFIEENPLYVSENGQHVNYFKLELLSSVFAKLLRCKTFPLGFRRVDDICDYIAGNPVILWEEKHRRMASIACEPVGGTIDKLNNLKPVRFMRTMAPTKGGHL
eukprot:TRINITY_DN4789_c0_g1_i1.p1 TRINITY_DN4789_c0_g1~~TRINITY_DN4789_c0_g1_i1.p1  ORF type:complete len:647 (-),score=160.31 TRINITY_DN4789_c0_g1_i1:110-2050(-)